MSGLWVFLAGFSVLFFHHGGYWAAHWYNKWALLITFFSVWVSFDIGKKTHWIVGLLVGYLLLNAASVGIWSGNIYRDKADELSLFAIEHNATYAYLVVLAAGLFLANFKPHWRSLTALYLASVCVAGTVSILLQPKGMPPLDGLYFGNPSMGCCLLAALLPCVWPFIQTAFLPRTAFCLIVLSWIAVAVAIWRTGTSIPVGILGVSTAAYCLSKFKPSKKVLAGIAALAALMIGGGQYVIGKDFFDNNRRFDTWKEIFTWWKSNSPMWTGSGLGTGQVLYPIIQNMSNKGAPRVDYFIWLHNDWLQVLLESGIIGLILVLLVWGYLLAKSCGRSAVFAALSGFSVMALMNYPLRLPIHSFCLLLICCLIFTPDEQVTE